MTPLNDKRGIVTAYCRLALSDSVYGGQFFLSDYNKVYFNSKDSLFVRALCYAWTTKNDSVREDSLVDEQLRKGIFIDDFVKKLALRQLK
jgi:hypothetical protein